MITWPHTPRLTFHRSVITWPHTPRLTFHRSAITWPHFHFTQIFLDYLEQRGQCILFSVVFTPPPSSHHGTFWVLPVISLLLTNSVSPVRACLIIWWEKFRGTQKRLFRGPLNIQSSLIWSLDSAGSFVYIANYFKGWRLETQCDSTTIIQVQYLCICIYVSRK